MWRHIHEGADKGDNVGPAGHQSTGPHTRPKRHAVGRLVVDTVRCARGCAGFCIFQIPDQNCTMLPSLRRLVLYLYSVFICQMTVMSFSPDKTRAFLPALLGDKYVDLMVVPCVVQRRDPPRALVVQFPTRCNRRGGEDTCTRGPIKGATSDPPVISPEARTHDQRGTRLGHW